MHLNIHTNIHIFLSLHSFRNVAGLQYIIETELTDLHQSRSVLMKEMKKIDKINLTDRAILEKAITCCLRPADNKILKESVELFYDLTMCVFM